MICERCGTECNGGAECGGRKLPPLARTTKALAQLRKSSVDTYCAWKPPIHIETFTCDNCVEASTCAYVFDGYNTDDDCLAGK